MARVLGYGGIANTNGARDFSTKVAAEVTTGGKIINIASRFTRGTEITLYILFRWIQGNV